jgi:hypothetical protein
MSTPECKCSHTTLGMRSFQNLRPANTLPVVVLVTDSLQCLLFTYLSRHLLPYHRLLRCHCSGSALASLSNVWAKSTPCREFSA